MPTTIGNIETARDRVSTALRARLTEHVARLAWTVDELALHQRSRLRALVAHAVARSPFHARRLGRLDLDVFELADLRHLPTMTKTEMTASFDEVLTDRRLNRRVVEQHLASSSDEPRLLLEDYVCLTSGGSSGERGVFVQTIDEYADFVASLTRRRMADLTAAGPDRPSLVIALVAAASPMHSSGFGAATSGGPVRLISCPATLPTPVLVKRLNDLQPPTLMGYPTKLAELAAEQIAGRLHIAPTAVTSISELLTDEDRSIITAAFGVAVVDQFVSTEGLVGQSDPGESILTFANDMCIAELVDEDAQPVEPGTVASKVLVTNLHNFTQPLIRYELTDRFVRHGHRSGHLRATVDGRADSVFRYGTVVVHPLTIRTVMAKASAVREYQVHQTPLGVHVDAVVSNKLGRQSLIADLHESLRAAGLHDPVVSVDEVPAIQRHPDTGKVRRFIPLVSG